MKITSRLTVLGVLGAFASLAFGCPVPKRPVEPDENDVDPVSAPDNRRPRQTDPRGPIGETPDDPNHPIPTSSPSISPAPGQGPTERPDAPPQTPPP